MLYNINYLTLQHNCIGLALGTNAAWPRQMPWTAGLYLTANVLKHCKLAPEKFRQKSTHSQIWAKYYYKIWFFSSVIKGKHITNKANNHLTFVLGWTINAKSLKQNIIVNKQIYDIGCYLCGMDRRRYVLVLSTEYSPTFMWRKFQCSTVSDQI